MITKTLPIAVQTTQVGVEAIQTSSARDLHAYLESGREFSHWIKFRINQYEFEEGVDFAVIKSVDGPSFGSATENTVAKKGVPQNTGVAAIEYYISIDMAKELSMVENNAKGREARKYFIAAEKEMKRLQAENQALTNWRLNNCHGAITTLQDDNGVERAKAMLPLRLEQVQRDKLIARNKRLDKKIELERLTLEVAIERNKPKNSTHLRRSLAEWKGGFRSLDSLISTLEKHLVE